MIQDLCFTGKKRKRQRKIASGVEFERRKGMIEIESLKENG